MPNPDPPLSPSEVGTASHGCSLDGWKREKGFPPSGCSLSLSLSHAKNENPHLAKLPPSFPFLPLALHALQQHRGQEVITGCSPEDNKIKRIDLLWGWKHWISAAVFLWGWIHQYHCHKILGSLRHSTDAEEYVIPHGDWFEIVSSPHYLSEIVIYASFVVATGGSNLTVWLLFAFVVANLSFAAVETHKWYSQKFKDYPSNRFAIIPFLL
ncbi:polyprenol reductase 1 [Vigna angularis]|uniref:polyprenol reductase 1 n=1 Tax=Phaseolus angularis TaxID=3914 RepID=UPI00080A0E5F|nr:polyprenol reductase 1 [Vigna angularis]